MRWLRQGCSAAATWTGLAIDLGGSLERRFRPGDLGAAYLDGLLR
jgi:hypothetical protein